MANLDSSFSLWCLQGVLGAVVYCILLAVYRLTFHPLARFPGPKLAAVTEFYAAYYDLPRTSSFVKELPELHDRYGQSPSWLAS